MNKNSEPRHKVTCQASKTKPRNRNNEHARWAYGEVQCADSTERPALAFSFFVAGRGLAFSEPRPFGIKTHSFQRWPDLLHRVLVGTNCLLHALGMLFVGEICPIDIPASTDCAVIRINFPFRAQPHLASSPWGEDAIRAVAKIIWPIRGSERQTHGQELPTPR